MIKWNRRKNNTEETCNFRNGWNCLFYAVFGKRLKNITALLDCEVSIDSRDFNGRTLLMISGNFLLIFFVRDLRPLSDGALLISCISIVLHNIIFIVFDYSKTCKFLLNVYAVTLIFCHIKLFILICIHWS